MKKLWAVLLFAFVSVAYGQDIIINSTSPYISVAQNATWAGNGVGTLQASWRFTPLAGYTGYCLYVENNDTGSHTITVNAYLTGNPFNSTVGIGLGWRTAPVSPLLGTATIAAGTTQIFYVASTGAAINKIITGTDGGSGRGNIALVQTTNSAACLQSGAPLTTASSNGGSPVTQWFPGSALPIIQCDQSKVVVVAAGATSVLIAGSSGKQIFICGFSLWETTVTTNPGPGVLFQTSTTAGACTGVTTRFGADLPVGLGQTTNYGGTLGMVMQPADINNAYCVNNGDTGGSISVAVSFAQF